MMSGVRGASFALAAVFAAELAFTGLATAQTTAPRPDYLFQLPERQWAVGQTLVGDRSRCEPGACEAGYHSGDLVLSVRRTDSELRALAAVRGCGRMAARVVKPQDLEGRSPADQWTVISRAAISAASAARTTCGSGVTDLIDTAGLVGIVPGYGWPHAG
jgi:hypothetical protein